MKINHAPTTSVARFAMCCAEKNVGRLMIRPAIRTAAKISA